MITNKLFYYTTIVDAGKTTIIYVRMSVSEQKF